MNFVTVLAILGRLALLLSFAISFHLLIAWYFGESIKPFLHSGVSSLIIGGIIFILFPIKVRDISQREGFMIVALGWIVTCLLGSLPYYFSGHFNSYIDALFESVSGFTTTGATILTNIEALPKSLLFFRSFSQWLGGMGIVLFSVALLPMLGIGGMQLMKAEVPGPTTDKLRPRVTETATSLWKLYLILTGLAFFLLLICGLSPFDAITHTFTTVSTGGFSTKNLSIEAFNNPAVEMVIILFMLLSGMNFSLHFLALNGNYRSYKKSEELKVFILIIIGITAFITLVLSGSDLYSDKGYGFFDKLRLSLFQVCSIITSTGFTSTNFDPWRFLHPLIPMLLFSIMFVGGCAGSTSGGLKVMRIIVLIKNMILDLKTLTHPRSAIQVSLDQKIISKEVMRAIVSFTVLYTFIILIGIFIVSLEVKDLWVNVSTVLATLGNVGPGFGATGPAGNYAFFSGGMKLFLSFLMLLGRLEIYTLLLLLYPYFWRRF